MKCPLDFSLSTERLRLASLTGETIEAVAKALLNERERVGAAFARTLQALEQDPAEYLRTSQHEWAQGERYRFGVWEASGFLGMVILRDIDWEQETAELAYLLLEGAEGKGYAYEATWAVVRWVEGELGLDLWLRIVPGNARSERLAARLGFRPDERPGADYVDAEGTVRTTKRYARVYDPEGQALLPLILALPEGYSEGCFKGRRYGVTSESFNDGRSRKVYAKELGGTDFVSFNLYRTAQGARIKPCEMPLPKVADFLRGLRSTSF